MSHIEDLIGRYFENKVSEEERAELLKLIVDGRIEESVKDKIAKTLSVQLRGCELPDLEMKTKGDDIFQLILSKNASSDKKVVHGDASTVRLKKPLNYYPAMLRYAAAVTVIVVAGVFAYSWEASDRNKPQKENGEVA